MFSFGNQSSPFDEVVEKATAETLLEENWGLMMDISDKVSSEGQKACKQVILSIKKRLNNRDPHVVIYALSLLDCLWKNAGTEFRRSVSSKGFISELRDKSISSTNAVAIKTCTILKEWSENECAKDPSLALVSSLYKELNDQGLFFENNEPKKSKQTFSTDPNVVSSSEEEAQLALAIQASLDDASIKKTPTVTSQYPSLSQSASQSYNNPPPPSYREVKALYDFEAAEENELTMKAGDSIMVLEDSDANWWKGQSHRGVGLFPSSFVTGDLAESNINNYSNGAVDTPTEEPPVQIDEESLMKCIQLLEECDPTGETPDPPALAYFENMALQMAPLIDKKLANIDRQHNMLANVDIAMRDVLASYDQAVQQVQIPQMHQMYNNFPQQQCFPNNFTPIQPQQQQQQSVSATQFVHPQGYGIHGVAAPRFPNNFAPFQYQQQQQPVAATQFFHPQQQIFTNEIQTNQDIQSQKPESQYPNRVADNQSNSTQQVAHSSPLPQQQQFQQPIAAAHLIRPQQQNVLAESERVAAQQVPTSQMPQMYNNFPPPQGYGIPDVAAPRLSNNFTPVQYQQQQQPVAATQFLHPQQQIIANEVQTNQEIQTPKPESHFSNQVADNQSNLTQHVASPIQPQSQQPVAAAHFVRPQQQNVSTESEHVAVQQVSTPQMPQMYNNSSQPQSFPDNFTPIQPQQQQQHQPVAATQFVHPQQQIIANEVESNRETQSPKPENQLLNQLGDNQSNSTQQVAHSSPIPQHQSQQPTAAAHLVRPQQQNVSTESEHVQGNETPVVNEETFVTI
uniref:Signal transducing adapter molecule 1 n=1 Tax=Panagrolaimus sp. ES5 TaxID=591445 RepID=A0AC34FQA1_9BILA